LKPKPGRTVYSTESPVARHGDACRREPASSRLPWEQSPRVQRETGGRGGKTVTTVAPLVLARPEAEALLASWKKMCGSGGSLKASRTTDGSPAFELEIQGDHADRLVAELVRAGYKAKRAGG
jgi:translation initiation factor 1 (eIF-1/SUI1)